MAPTLAAWREAVTILPPGILPTDQAGAASRIYNAMAATASFIASLLIKRGKTMMDNNFQFTVLMIMLFVGVTACHSGDGSVEIGDDDLGGTVTGQYGPEAGVWVIAETYDL